MFSQILTFLIFFLLINDFFKTIASSLSQSQDIDNFSESIYFARDIWRHRYCAIPFEIQDGGQVPGSGGGRGAILHSRSFFARIPHLTFLSYRYPASRSQFQLIPFPSSSQIPNPAPFFLWNPGSRKYPSWPWSILHCVKIKCFF